MANLKEIRLRIKSVKNTQQVTKAMKLVSASKLRRSQDQILEFRPYALKLKEIIASLLSKSEGEIESVYAEKREVKKQLVILVTSNRGLCGAFNNSLFKHVGAELENHSEMLEAGNIEFLCVGKKGFEFCKRNNFPIYEDKFFDLVNHPSFDESLEVIETVKKDFADEKWDRVYLSYNEFKNVLVQIKRFDQLLPIDLEKVDEEEQEAFGVDYIMEPSSKEIVESLIPKSVNVAFYRAILESVASENGSRMTAMDAATNNAEDLLSALKLSYNRARQAAITTEILEISAGAEALTS